jgi:DNA gyrase subunit A
VHRLEGLLIALDHLDEVIELIRGSRDRDEARAGLIDRFGLTHIQAQAILELRLQQLTALEADSIKREHADKLERITELRELLGNEGKVYSLIKEELAEIADRYGDERRTQITFAEDDLDIEDLIADQQMVITITKSGYIKSLPLATYRQQRRGGVGVAGMGMKDEDYIEHLFVCSTHDYLLFFTNRGKVYRSKVYDLPDAPSRQSKGRHLGNVLPLREGERVQSVLATRDYSESKSLLFATKRGTVKKTELQAYNTPIKADGIIAIKIRDDDELVAVRRVDEGDEVLMVSKAGLTVRFSEDDARSMGRDTSGVRGMDVGNGDNEVIAMDIARDDQYLLVVTENGFGKRTPVADYRKTSRGAKGVKTIQQTEAKGALAAALVVRDHHQLVFISQNGMVQRIGVRDLRPLGRNAQGFRLMNVRDDDLVSAVALVMETETSAAVADEGPVSLDASGVADEPALEGDAVFIGDPDEEALLDVPELESDEMPDSDVEEE